MTAVVALSIVLAVLLVAFVSFFIHSRTLAWGNSETRKAVLRMLVVIGPYFGMHYRPPRPEVPTISTPAGDADPNLPAVSAEPGPDDSASTRRTRWRGVQR